ncbi:hypothetical protein [Nocardia thraciensis]
MRTGHASRGLTGGSTTASRVSYELTGLGAAGAAHLCALIEWIGDSAPEITAARQRVDEVS